MDDDGLITWVNLIIATGQNNLAMNRGVLQIARHFVHGNKLAEGMLNRVEAGIRAFDPCLSCSTHADGRMALEMELRSHDGELLDSIGKPVSAPPAHHRLWQPAPRRRRLRLSRRGAPRGPDPDPDVEIHAVHQLTPELMDPLSKAERAIFIDASTGPTPGEVQERVVDPIHRLLRNSPTT